MEESNNHSPRNGSSRNSQWRNELREMHSDPKDRNRVVSPRNDERSSFRPIDIETSQGFDMNRNPNQIDSFRRDQRMPAHVSSRASPSANQRNPIIDINIVLSMDGRSPRTSISRNDRRTPTIGTNQTIEDVRFIDIDLQVPSRTLHIRTDGHEQR